MDSRLVHQWQPLTDRSASAEREFVGLADIAVFLRRHVRTIAVAVVLAMLCGLFYVATTDRIYTAQTQILIEPKLPQLLQQQAAEVNLTLDTAQIESQMAVMQSEKIATMVIDDLRLATDPNFIRSRSPSFSERLTKLFQRAGLFRNADAPVDTSALSEFELSRATMGAYQAGLDVRRVGVSYAINISFQSLDPETAAKVANATADAFVREQLETRSSSAREGGAWLEQRLNELRKQMNQATQVAQEFRAKHDYAVGGVRGEAANEEHAANGAPAPTLEELEATADTYRKMYESFLQAYTSSVSQQSYLIAEARVITAATRPLSASSPRPKLVMAFSLIAGLMAGLGVAFIRHSLDHTVRSARQLREDFGVECLAELPPLSGKGLLKEVVVSPSSDYSSSARAAKAAIGQADAAGALRCIGVVSALPSDGKSTFASNLAALYAMSGLRTLVIDADAVYSVLSNSLLQHVDRTEPVGRATNVDAITRYIVPVPRLKFDVLPSTAADSSNLLASSHMRALLGQLQAYDIILVDLPPLTSGSERLAVGPLLDGVILVAEWGRTPLDLFGELVRSLHASKTSIIGVLLTNVRIRSSNTLRGRRKLKAR